MVAKRPTRKKKTLTGKAGVLKLGDQVVKPLTLTEQVLNERNLSGFLENPSSSSAPVHKETRHGKVRIEGAVTAEKLLLAEEFDRQFAASVDEVMTLAEYTPSESTMAFVKNARLSHKQVQEIKSAPAWTTFQINGETLMKTQDNKLENVKDYCFRLERAVLHQLKLKTEIQNTLVKTSTELATVKRRLESYEGDYDLNSQFVNLRIKALYGKLTAFVIKLLS